MKADEKTIDRLLEVIPNDYFKRSKYSGYSYRHRLIDFAQKIYFYGTQEYDTKTVKNIAFHLSVMALDFMYKNYFDGDMEECKKNIKKDILLWLQVARDKHPIYAITLDNAYRVIKEEQRELCLALVFEDKKRQLAECCDLVSVCIRCIQNEWKNAESNNE